MIWGFLHPVQGSKYGLFWVDVARALLNCDTVSKDLCENYAAQIFIFDTVVTCNSFHHAGMVWCRGSCILKLHWETAIKRKASVLFIIILIPNFLSVCLCSTLYLHLLLLGGNVEASQKELNDHKRELFLKEPDNSQEVIGACGKPNVDVKTERDTLSTGVPPLSSSMGGMDTLSKGADITKKGKNKRVPPSTRSATMEDVKHFSAVSRRPEAEKLAQETAESQTVMAKPTASDYPMNGAETSSGIHHEMDPLKDTSKEKVASILVGHESEPEKAGRTLNPFPTLKDNGKVSRFYKSESPIVQSSTFVGKCPSGSLLKEQNVPIVVRDVGGDNLMHMAKPLKDANMFKTHVGTTENLDTSQPVLSNNGPYIRRLPDVQKQRTSDGLNTVTFSNTAKYGKSVTLQDKSTEEEGNLSISNGMLFSPTKYSTSEKWIMDQQKRKLLNDQNWESKQRKTDERIAACFDKLKVLLLHNCIWTYCLIVHFRIYGFLVMVVLYFLRFY